MKYFKRYFDLKNPSVPDFKSSQIEISHDEFHELCESSDSYFLSHFLIDDEICHIICLSNIVIK